MAAARGLAAPAQSDRSRTSTNHRGRHSAGLGAFMGSRTSGGPRPERRVGRAAIAVPWEITRAIAGRRFLVSVDERVDRHRRAPTRDGQHQGGDWSTPSAARVWVQAWAQVWSGSRRVAGRVGTGTQPCPQPRPQLGWTTWMDRHVGAPFSRPAPPTSVVTTTGVQPRSSGRHACGVIQLSFQKLESPLRARRGRGRMMRVCGVSGRPAEGEHASESSTPVGSDPSRTHPLQGVESFRTGRQ